MLDGDSGGKKSKKKYEDKFGDFIKDKIFTLEDVLNLNNASEAMISKDSKRQIYDSIFGNGTFNQMKGKEKKLKENLNYAINQLLVQNKVLTIDKPTKDNFEKLFSFLRDKI